MAGHGMARRWAPPLVIGLLLVCGICMMLRRSQDSDSPVFPSAETARGDPCHVPSFAIPLSQTVVADANGVAGAESSAVLDEIDDEEATIADQEPVAAEAIQERPTAVEPAAVSKPSSSAMIRGILVDVEGNPVEGYVTVEYAVNDPNETPSSSFAFPVPDVQPAGGLRGLARDVSGALGCRFLWPDGDPNEELVLVLEPCGSVIGHVVAGNRQPVTGVRLDLQTQMLSRRWQGGDTLLDPPIIDEEGYFLFDRVPPGLKMKVTAHRGTLSGQSRRLELRPGETADAGEIRMIGGRPGEGTIQGRIIDERGRPLADRAIQVQLGRSAQWLRTDAGGYFVITDLPRDEPVTVRIDVDGYGSWSRTAIPDDFACDFRLCPQGYDIVGKEALPVFAGTWFNHEPTTLEQLRGQVIVLAFRGFDRDVDPGLARLRAVQNDYGSDGLQVIAIYNCLPTTSALAEDIISGHLITLFEGAAIAGVLDADTAVVADLMPAERPAGAGAGATHWMYQVHERPAFFLIDKAGIVRHGTGADTELRDWIERLLDE